MWGFFLPNGKVLSKWGCGAVWEHDVQAVVKLYGDAYRMMHNPVKAEVIKHFLAVVHQECFWGQRQFSIHRLEQILLEQWNHVKINLLPNSFLGLHFNEWAKGELLQRIADLEADLVAKELVEQVAAEVNALPIPDRFFERMSGERVS